MDRRQLLNAMVSRGTESAARNQALPIAGGLNPYNGPWNYAAAAHLLRRAMFGPTHEQIKQAVAEGLGATMARLLKKQPIQLPHLIILQHLQILIVM